MLVAYMAAVTGGSMTHIPLKSDAEVVRETAAGMLHFSTTTTQFAMPLIQDKRIRPIAVSGTQRLKALPDVPSLGEQNYEELKGFNAYTFYTLIGPRGMPAPLVEKLNDAANKVSAMPDVAARLQTLYMEPMPGTPAAFRQFVEKELVKWREVGKKVPLDPTK
jgi:tripartite-type tricarboxylate transporter receptor subunit TctC